MVDKKIAISAEEITAMKQRATDLISFYGKRDRELYARYREMFFIEPAEAARDQTVDEKDWAITRSPTSRNEVIGMVRLLETSTLSIHVPDADQADS